MCVYVCVCVWVCMGESVCVCVCVYVLVSVCVGVCLHYIRKTSSLHLLIEKTIALMCNFFFIELLRSR